MMATKDFFTAAVLLPPSETSATAPTLDAVAAAAKAAGAGPLVVVVPRGFSAPPVGRTVHVAPRASRISAIRAGMAQLTNTPSKFALVLPRTAGSADVTTLEALIAAAKEQPGAMFARAGADLDDTPLLLTRDAWLPLLTIGERGMEAVAGKVGVVRV
jgi:hypothetical protein